MKSDIDCTYTTHGWMTGFLAALPKEYNGPPVIAVRADSARKQGDYTQLCDGDSPLPVAITLPVDIEPGDVVVIDTRDGEVLAVGRGSEFVYGPKLLPLPASFQNPE